MSIFETTGEQKSTQEIDAQLRQAANVMKQSYLQIRQMVYQNANFSPEQIYSAFATYTTTGLSPEDLGKSARLIKAAINQFAPNTIQDDVPEANISYGE